MDVDKVYLVAHSDQEMSETFAFKLTSDLKESFVQLCLENNLSTGRVMRELLRQFIETSYKGGSND